jgi:uncharacterized protein
MPSWLSMPVFRPFRYSRLMRRPVGALASNARIANLRRVRARRLNLKNCRNFVRVLRQLASEAHSSARAGLASTFSAPALVNVVYDSNIHIMLDLAQIEGFDWDEGNNRKSVEKHDVSQAEAEQIFFNDPLLVVEDVSHSVSELSLQALGRTDAGRLLHVSFTLRGDGKLIRVISARTMHRKERLRYEHES